LRADINKGKEKIEILEKGRRKRLHPCEDEWGVLRERSTPDPAI